MKLFVFPGNIEEEILAIGAQQVPYVRTSRFSEMWLASERRLLKIAGNQGGRVLAFTASGTGAMDSCMGALSGHVHKKALVINGGTFGQRWLDLCRYYNIPHDAFPVPFGCDPDYDSLRKVLLSGDYSMVLMQHHETSSGCLYDLDAISKWCREADVYITVDAIGSFLADDFSMTRNHIDVAIISSHKGLNLPPGLSFVLLSETLALHQNWKAGSYYFDWKTHSENWRRGQPPFSPATHLFLQLDERLKRIEQTGVPNVIRSVKDKANAFRSACVEEGWTLNSGCKSNCLTGVTLPCLAQPIVDALASKGFFVMPSAEPNLIRVAHLGTSTISDHNDLIKEIRQCIQKNNA